VDDDEIEDLFLSVIRELAQRDTEDRARWRRLVSGDQELGMHLLRSLNRAREMADTEFAKPLTVDDLAERAAISKYHFIRLFERAFGSTPHRYLVARRLDHARHRLATDDVSVSDLREECGFAGLGSFSWAFKRAYGMSPSRFAIFEKSKAARRQ
jgi:AraC-like DNA-binding protein